MRAAERWVALHIEPDRFFAEVRGSAWDRYAWIAILVVGFAAVVNRLDLSMLGASTPGARTALPNGALDSWPAFWSSMIVGAPIMGSISWLVGGFWTRLRARWCGAADPDARVARLISLYARLVSALPLLGLVVIWTMYFPGYRAASDSARFAAVVAIIVLSFWSVYVSYRGASASFALSRRRAIFWFLILPAFVEAAAFGLGVGLQAMRAGG